MHAERAGGRDRGHLARHTGFAAEGFWAGVSAGVKEKVTSSWQESWGLVMSSRRSIEECKIRLAEAKRVQEEYKNVLRDLREETGMAKDASIEKLRSGTQKPH